MKKNSLIIALSMLFLQNGFTQLPETGVSGVYEVVLASEQPDLDLRYFGEFGFRIVDSATFTAAQAERLYGFSSNLKSYRLQNGTIDAHGLLRLLVWEQPAGKGVGYAPAETIGRRMAVMHCRDIVRLTDIFKKERDNGKPYLVTDPIFDVIYANSGVAKPDFFQRSAGVRENAVYGESFSHVFFQRYGYHIKGYGTINPDAPLGTSEFTHHDFIIKGDTNSVKYLSRVLGLKQESPASLDGDWRAGPKNTFMMPTGYSHYYIGFVSPNNICGKLKFFIPQIPVADRSNLQQIGQLGITLHTFYVSKLGAVYEAARKEGFKLFGMGFNEFKERSFVFTAQDGVSWQIIERPAPPKNAPVTTFEMTKIRN